jgi:hypothetical protein
MKTVITAVLLILIIGNIQAVDTDSYQFIDRLRSISKPGMPEIFEDGVVFAVPSSYRRVGISFAHEGYAKVHWFRRLLIPKDTVDLYNAKGKPLKKVDPTTDSGIMFHVETIPANVRNMDYRMIIDGLWTTDPQNPFSVTGPSGIVESRVPLPEPPKNSFQNAAAPGTYRFIFRTAPGETVTVAGSFNNWDPFMYELREISPGFYTITLPLPPGNFQYLFCYRGEQIPDPENTRKLYARDGRIISEATIP